MGPRVLIIKLAALGDVVRTACLLPTLASLEEPPFVTWLTSPAAAPLVRRMPGVHRVLAFSSETVTHLELESFDLVISLDKEPAPAAVAMRMQTQDRVGIGLSRYGTVYPLNEEAHYYFRLGLDDDEKFFRNGKSYPQLIHEAVGLRYAGRRYELQTTAEDREAAERRVRAAGVPDGAWPLIGINPGAGHVFANKAWREEGYVELLHALRVHYPEGAALLLGGPDEAQLIDRLLHAAPGFAHHPGTDNDLGTFVGLIERCDVVVSGDTLAMHLALALGRRSVAIFGPTCPQEIEMFGLGERIVTPIGCAPCYLRFCDRQPNCQDLIDSATVLAAVLRQVEQTGQRRPVDPAAARPVSPSN